MLYQSIQLYERLCEIGLLCARGGEGWLEEADAAEYDDTPATPDEELVVVD